MHVNCSAHWACSAVLACSISLSNSALANGPAARQGLEGTWITGVAPVECARLPGTYYVHARRPSFRGEQFHHNPQPRLWGVVQDRAAGIFPNRHPLPLRPTTRRATYLHRGVQDLSDNRAQ